MATERYVEVFSLGDGRWAYRVVKDGKPGVSSAAKPSAFDALHDAVIRYPEDEIRLEERHG